MDDPAERYKTTVILPGNHRSAKRFDKDFPIKPVLSKNRHSGIMAFIHPNRLLLVIDAQPEMIRPHRGQQVTDPQGLRRTINNIGSLLSDVRASGLMPVVHFAMAPHATAGMEEVRYLETCEPTADEPSFLKFDVSGFETQSFKDYLAAAKFRDVYFVGFDASVCVPGNALAARNVGLIPHIIVDAVGSRQARIKCAALEAMRDYGINLITSENFLKGNRNAPVPAGRLAPSKRMQGLSL